MFRQAFNGVCLAGEPQWHTKQVFKVTWTELKFHLHWLKKKVHIRVQTPWLCTNMHNSLFKESLWHRGPWLQLCPGTTALMFSEQGQDRLFLHCSTRQHSICDSTSHHSWREFTVARVAHLNLTPTTVRRNVQSRIYSMRFIKITWGFPTGHA